MIAALAFAQESRVSGQELNLPFGPVTRLPSPDGLRVLYGVPYQRGVNDGPQLWIEDLRTHQRNQLLSISDTLGAMWSADGSAFAVLDHSASDSATTYIYDANTLRSLDVAGPILAADPGATRFAEGHAYFDLERWETEERVTIRFHGHTDEPPVTCFDFRYRVSRVGAVEKLSGRVFPIDKHKFCS